MKKLILIPILLLTACADTSTREVSRADMAAPSGMTYNQFRSHDMNNGSSSLEAQKRFIQMDRDNNGRLTANEGGY